MEIAKPAAAVILGMKGAAFLPDERQRHISALQLAVDCRPIRLRLDKTADAADRVDQQRFQVGVRHLRSKRPAERGPFDPLQIPAGRTLPDAMFVAIFRVDNPLAQSRSASVILRIVSLFMEPPALFERASLAATGLPGSVRPSPEKGDRIRSESLTGSPRNAQSASELFDPPLTLDAEVCRIRHQ